MNESACTRSDSKRWRDVSAGVGRETLCHGYTRHKTQALVPVTPYVRQAGRTRPRAPHLRVPNSSKTRMLGYQLDTSSDATRLQRRHVSSTGCKLASVCKLYVHT